MASQGKPETKDTDKVTDSTHKDKDYSDISEAEPSASNSGKASGKKQAGGEKDLKSNPKSSSSHHSSKSSGKSRKSSPVRHRSSSSSSSTGRYTK